MGFQGLGGPTTYTVHRRRATIFDDPIPTGFQSGTFLLKLKTASLSTQKATHESLMSDREVLVVSTTPSTRRRTTLEVHGL